MTPIGGGLGFLLKEYIMKPITKEIPMTIYPTILFFMNKKD